MPLNRSPTRKSGSECNLKDMVLDATLSPGLEAQTYINMQRQKRKRDGVESEDILKEMQKLFNEFVEIQNAKLSNLQSGIEGIKVQNDSISSSIQLLSDKYDDIQKELDILQKCKNENMLYIKNLEFKMEALEKNTNSTKIEIRNLPKNEGETKGSLTKLMCDLGQTLRISIKPSEIKDIYRGFAKSEVLKPLVVDFTTVIMKESFIKSAKLYNKNNKGSKLNTSVLKMPGTPKPIFVSECLTSKGKRLFYLAREFVKTYNYKFCWTSYGRIYVRKEEGAPQIKINEESDLAKLKSDSK